MTNTPILHSEYPRQIPQAYGSANALKRFAERLFLSRHYELFITLGAGVILAFPDIRIGFALMCLFACFMLVFCADLLALFSPFLSICLLSTRFYSDYRALLEFWPVFLIGAVSLIAHFILYRAPLRKGEMTMPLVAVSAATMLGGIGKIAVGQYFSPLSLYYSIGLGPAMLLLYTLFLSQFQKPHAYDQLGKFLSTLYHAGLLAAIVVLWTYAFRFSEFLETGSSIYMAYRNYLATTMLVALPCACILRIGRSRFFGMGLLYGALLLSGSRSGLFFGSIELVCSLLWCFIRLEKTQRRIVAKAAAALLPVCSVLIVFIAKALFASRLIDGMIICEHDSRYTFFAQGIRDFLSAPIFGIGLGNLKNSPIFIGVSGSIVWYHNIIAQVLGSLGLVGAAAYGWMYYKRFQLLFRRRSAKMVAASLAIAGMMMINLTNPGEFCPFPNAMIMVALFTTIELLPKRYAVLQLPLRQSA